MIRIVIVEDHTLFREGIKSLLEKSNDFLVAGEFCNGQEFCDNLHTLQADVALLDIEMPLMSGLEAARVSSVKKPGLRLIALSMYGDQHYYYEMIRAGISGFVLKEASSTELEKAIRDVHEGMGFFSPELLQKAFAHSPVVESRRKKLEELQLTEREFEVLQLICKGLTNTEISERLFLSPKTIESHKSKLFLKTSTRNTASLAIFAIKNDLIEI
jgi:DNA-binding NarL/FixJ family response regulator